VPFGAPLAHPDAVAAAHAHQNYVVLSRVYPEIGTFYRLPAGPPAYAVVKIRRGQGDMPCRGKQFQSGHRFDHFAQRRDLRPVGEQSGADPAE